MIFVDTSVWVAALRSAGSDEARQLRALLDLDEVGLPVIVRLEILSGASRGDRGLLRRTLSALPEYRPRDETWDRVDGWIERASEAGLRFGITDLLLAAIAAEAGASVWSLDRDFDRMAQLDFVDVHISADEGA